MKKSYTQLLVENHPCGKLVKGVLDTPEKIRAYEERMRAILSDRPRIKINRRRTR